MKKTKNKGTTTKSIKTDSGFRYTPYDRMTEEQRQKIRDYQRRKREENKDNIEWQLQQAIYHQNYYNRKVEELKAKLQKENMK